MRPCGVCGYWKTKAVGVAHLCYRCRRLADSYCWRKIQGFTQEDIRPWHVQGMSGMPYLCILCGFWHWTSRENPPPGRLENRVWAMHDYFISVGFHINVARGRNRFRVFDRGDEA